MYKTRISKDDPEVLKQQILHYKSEISRYEKKLKEYQENYYYHLIDELRKENARLSELVSELQTSSMEKGDGREKEQIEHQLHLIRDKSIEQLSEMKEENDRLKTELDNLQNKINQLENMEAKRTEGSTEQELIVKREETEQSDWFMRSLRERDAMNDMADKEDRS